MKLRITLALAIVGFVLMFIPYVIKNPYILGVFVFLNIASIFAASWDIIGGYSGQISFGHAAFFGSAGYVTGYLAGGRPMGQIASFRISPWLAFIIGPCFASLLGFLVGILCVRKRGAYTTLITLAFTLMLQRLIMLDPYWLGSEEGITGMTPFTFNRVSNYQISVFLLVGSTAILYLIGHSRIGLTLKALREDEDAAEALGIDTAKYKVFSFVIGAFFAGLAGSFQSLYMLHAGVVELGMHRSAQAVWYTILGGRATIIGPIIGAYLLRGSLEIFAELREFHLLVSNVMVVLVVLFYSEGLVKAIQEILAKIGIAKKENV